MVDMRRRVANVGLLCFCGLLVATLSLGQEVEGRRLRGLAEQAQYAEMARALNLGEVVLRVMSTGAADVIAVGKYCGTISLASARLSEEAYRQEFFAQLDGLLKGQTGLGIREFTDLFLFFDSNVSEDEVARHRSVFRREKAYYYNCCTEEHAYACCSSSISPWLLRVPVDPPPNWGEIIRCIQALKVYEIARINVLVVSDGGLHDFGELGGQRRLGSATLVAWLSDFEGVGAVQELRLVVRSGAVSLEGTRPVWLGRHNAITIVILAYDRSRYGTLADGVEQAVLDAVAGGEVIPLILLAFPEPKVDTVSQSLLTEPLRPLSGGVVLVSAVAQPGKVLEEALAAVQRQRAAQERLDLFGVMVALRHYGFVAYSYCAASSAGR